MFSISPIIFLLYETLQCCSPDHFPLPIPHYAPPAINICGRALEYTSSGSSEQSLELCVRIVVMYHNILNYFIFDIVISVIIIVCYSLTFIWSPKNVFMLLSSSSLSSLQFSPFAGQSSLGSSLFFNPAGPG